MPEKDINNEEKKETKACERDICYKHPVLKVLVLCVIIFAAIFCAVYVVIDWHIKSLFMPGPVLSQPFQTEQNINKEIDNMSKIMNKIEERNFSVPKLITLDSSNDKYLIKVDLRAFDNNPDNVTVDTNDKMLMINARTIKKSKHGGKEISRYQQTYSFGSDADLENYQTSQRGHELLIIVPRK